MHPRSQRSIPNRPRPDSFSCLPDSLSVTTFTDGEFATPGGISFPSQTVLIIIHVSCSPEPFPCRFYGHPNTLLLRVRSTDPPRPPGSAGQKCRGRPLPKHLHGHFSLTSPRQPACTSQLGKQEPASTKRKPSAASQITPSLLREALVSVSEDVRISKGGKDSSSGLQPRR